MFIIREEQMAALSDYMSRKFEDSMVIHCNLYYSQKCKLIGEQTLRNIICHGIEQAERYGIISEYDVSRYINLMFTFNRDFDKDPGLPWVSKILHNDDLTSTRKMDVLYEEAAKRLPGSEG